MKKIFVFLTVLICFQFFTASVWGEFYVVPVAGDRIKGTTSYLWISGNGVRPYNHNDSTVIDMDTVGGAKIFRNSGTGNRNVMLPVTVAGPDLGHPVKITALDIYWKGETESDAISAVLLRRQTGICATSTCYEVLLHDSADHTCGDGIHPEGCTLHYDITINNVLTENSGILYITIELSFSSDTSWVEIGGARLTLEYQ